MTTKKIKSKIFDKQHGFYNVSEEDLLKVFSDKELRDTLGNYYQLYKYEKAKSPDTTKLLLDKMDMERLTELWRRKKCKK